MAIHVELEQIGPTTTEATIRGHTVQIDRPEAKDGHDRGPMGGELLLAALGGCFASNLMAAINARQAPISNVRIRVEGDPDDAPPHFAAIRLAVQAETDDSELLDKLVLMSERACIVSNTLKRAADVTVTAETSSD